MLILLTRKKESKTGRQVRKIGWELREGVYQKRNYHTQENFRTDDMLSFIAKQQAWNNQQTYRRQSF